MRIYVYTGFPVETLNESPFEVVEFDYSSWPQDQMVLVTPQQIEEIHFDPDRPPGAENQESKTGYILYHQGGTVVNLSRFDSHILESIAAITDLRSWKELEKALCTRQISTDWEDLIKNRTTRTNQNFFEELAIDDFDFHNQEEEEHIKKCEACYTRFIINAKNYFHQVDGDDPRRLRIVK